LREKKINIKIMLFEGSVFLDRRDDKVIINSHTQSENTGVRTPVLTSSLTISAFLSVELRLMMIAFLNVVFSGLSLSSLYDCVKISLINIIFVLFKKKKKNGIPI